LIETSTLASPDAGPVEPDLIGLLAVPQMSVAGVEQPAV